jgi:Beta-galactosidase
VKVKARLVGCVVAATVMVVLLGSAQIGLCALARGIFALGQPGGSIPQGILENQNVDGVALLFLWNHIEPNEGRFRWNDIDREVARIRASGKVYSLGVTPGFNTPAWVYKDGAAAFEFRWDKPWGPAPCSLVRFPIPWDTIYLEKWRTFVRALGTRYAHDPHLVLLKIQGVNAQTPEFLLPHDRPGDSNGSRLVNCSPSDEVAEWQTVGYRPSKIRQAWAMSAKAYAEAFPKQQLAIETGPWGMPPIDNSGNPIANRASDVDLPISIVTTGKQVLDGRFVVQNDGLKATWGWPQLQEIASPEMIAFQMVWKVTDDPTCRMNNFEHPCDPARMLQAAIDRGIAAGAVYMEIYQADLVNPGLTKIVADAQRRLRSRNDQ